MELERRLAGNFEADAEAVIDAHTVEEEKPEGVYVMDAPSNSDGEKSAPAAFSFKVSLKDKVVVSSVIHQPEPIANKLKLNLRMASPLGVNVDPSDEETAEVI